MSLPAPRPDAAALITGASSGIGRELARALAARGHGVILVARTAARLEELATELADAHGVRAEALPCDLADADDRDALAAAVERLGLDVDVLVNSAGFGTYTSFVDAPRERVLGEIRLDVEAVADLMSRWVPGMVERGAGAVINLSSTSALQPLPFNATYAAAKSFVLLLSEGVHHELKGTGVTITAVLPGPVATEFQERNDAGFADKLPKAVWASPQRVAADALAAADAGRRSVIPGGLAVKAAFGPNRFAPKAVAIPVAGRLMRP